MENGNNKSATQKATRGAEIVRGASRIAGGIASGNFVAVAQGSVQVLSPKIIVIIILILVFILLIPVMIFASIPQILFNWTTINDEDLIKRNVHASEIASYYEETYKKQPEGLKTDICWLISIESVLHKQKVENISRKDVEESFRRSYSIDNTTGIIYSKSPETIMNELGFSDEEKNWASLMHSTISDQYIPPGSDMADNDFPESELTENNDGSLMGKNGETIVTYYSQLDERWADKAYGKSGTIGSSGCGPTALAIVASTLKGKNITPEQVADWSVKNGYRCEGNGSYHSLIPNGAKNYGLKVEKLGRSSKEELARHLSNGNLVIAIMSKGHFTNGGHFIVLRGITKEGKVLVADPASRKRSNQEWSMSIILNEARGTAAAGGPFWSISI